MGQNDHNINSTHKILCDINSIYILITHFMALWVELWHTVQYFKQQSPDLRSFLKYSLNSYTSKALKTSLNTKIQDFVRNIKVRLADLLISVLECLVCNWLDRLFILYTSLPEIAPPTLMGYFCNITWFDSIQISSMVEIQIENTVNI